MGSKATLRRRAQKARAKGRNQAQMTNQLLVDSAKATGSNTTTVAADTRTGPQNWQLVQTPPRNFINRISWIKSTYSEIVTVLASGAYTEKNVAFQINNLPNYTYFTSAFDQYCIYAVTVTVSLDGSTSSSAPVSLYTAIDYDNVSAIGLAGIEAYSNLNQCTITPQNSLVRFILPCIATNLYGSSGFGSYGTTRSWVNANSASVQHYGFRAVYVQPTSQTVMRHNYEFIIGLRNAF